MGTSKCSQWRNQLNIARWSIKWNDVTYSTDKLFKMFLNEVFPSVHNIAAQQRTCIQAKSGLASHCKGFDEAHSVLELFTGSKGVIYIIHSNQ